MKLNKFNYVCNETETGSITEIKIEFAIPMELKLAVLKQKTPSPSGINQ